MNSVSPYLEAFKGSFTSTLRWHQLDALWQTLRENNHGQWFIYPVGEAVPTTPVPKQDLDLFIDEIDALLHKEHQEDYCGIVYADELSAPTMIKIFDPDNLGVVCGFSNNPPLPGWVLSLLPPEDLPDAFPPPNNRKHWWNNIFKTFTHKIST